MVVQVTRKTVKVKRVGTILVRMKRSEINALYLNAKNCFARNGWALPGNARWDVTDFGLGEYRKFGLVLVNLAEEAEYSEKLMYAQKGMTTPAHCHAIKKEDIISRWGTLAVTVWKGKPQETKGQGFEIKVDRVVRAVTSGETITLLAGQRVTIVPGVYHEFVAVSNECIIGEVSTANDDANDNFFVNPEVGRFPRIEEDEKPFVRLISDSK
jgi:D-lyxose ketol-isomerase